MGTFNSIEELLKNVDGKLVDKILLYRGTRGVLWKLVLEKDNKLLDLIIRCRDGKVVVGR